MYTLEGFFTEISPDRRTTMLDGGMAAMAAVHAVDWQRPGPRLAADPRCRTDRRPPARHLAGLRRARAGRAHPPHWERGLAWLRARTPEGSAPVLCWGDPRPGNVIWRDDRPACLTDFEAACIAPPEVDLGWWLMSDRWAHEITGAERLPGEPTRAQQTAAYEAASGRSVGDTTWWEVFAATRYTAIVVRVMNRMVDRGHLPADQTIWLENPAAACLDHLLEEIDA